jgi:hypothetical protein
MKKSVAIIGEGETEWFYFESMRTFHHYSFKMAPDFPLNVMADEAIFYVLL